MLDEPNLFVSKLLKDLIALNQRQLLHAEMINKERNSMEYYSPRGFPYA
jgi:hypothetical protein